MNYYCFHCNVEVVLSSSGTVGRKEECCKCKADLHCCRNCKFYDEAVYNECREPQAERVIEKNRGNFCDYFTFIEGPHEGSSGKDKTLKDLDSLFK